MWNAPDLISLTIKTELQRTALALVVAQEGAERKQKGVAQAAAAKTKEDADHKATKT